MEEGRRAVGWFVLGLTWVCLILWILFMGMTWRDVGWFALGVGWACLVFWVITMWREVNGR